MAVNYSVTVIGGCNVGKTWIIHRMEEGDKFTGRNEIGKVLGATIGTNYITLAGKTFGLQCDSGVKFTVFDTAGSEAYDSVVVLFLLSAHAVVVVFDITNEMSFEVAKFKVEKAKETGKKLVHLILVRNKVDLHKDREVVGGQQYAIENGIDYMETSAKTGFNVDLLFRSIAAKLWLQASVADPSIIVLKDKSEEEKMEEKKSGFKCCIGNTSNINLKLV